MVKMKKQSEHIQKYIVLIDYVKGFDDMKIFDKEYSTQYTPENEYLYSKGIKPSFVKTINEVTTYKYTKTPELFLALVSFYIKK